MSHRPNRRNPFFLTLALFALLPLLAIAAAPPLAAATWEIDPVHSDVGFKVRHFVSNVPGEFNDFSGTIVYDAEHPEKSSVEITVQAASIDTGNDERDNHLRSADFFAVEEYPTLHFMSTAVKAKGNELAVLGELTIRGVTKTVTVPVTVLGTMETPNGAKAGFEAELVIDRQDYGVQWNRTLDQGAMLSDEVTLTIAIEANRVEPEGESQPGS